MSTKLKSPTVRVARAPTKTRRVSTFNPSNTVVSHLLSYGEEFREKEWHEVETWHEKLAHVLHHVLVHRFLIGCLIVDIMLVVASVIVERVVLEDELEVCEHFAEECTDAGECDGPYEPHEGHFLHDMEHSFVICSVFILSLFALENVLLLLALGRKYFWNIFYPFDMVVVGVSLWLELWGNNPAGGMLIIARMWRFVRIAHGLRETFVNKEDHMLAERLTDDLEQLANIFEALPPRAHNLMRAYGDCKLSTFHTMREENYEIKLSSKVIFAMQEWAHHKAEAKKEMEEMGEVLESVEDRLSRMVTGGSSEPVLRPEEDKEVSPGFELGAVKVSIDNGQEETEEQKEPQEDTTVNDGA